MEILPQKITLKRRSPVGWLLPPNGSRVAPIPLKLERSCFENIGMDVNG
jgi:hypothetical protein